MPSRQVVYNWLWDDEHAKEGEGSGFVYLYARAREEQADTWAEEIIEISDDGSNDTYVIDEETGETGVNHDHIQRSKLRVDSRKWIAAKLKPRKYGDKVTQELTGPEGGAVQVQQLGPWDGLQAAFDKILNKDAPK
jgi:hypothetical protein